MAGPGIPSARAIMPEDALYHMSLNCSTDGVCFTLDWTWALILDSVAFFKIRPDFHTTFYK